jgi:hypothetical protein
MKTTGTTRAFCIFFVLAILISGCASTTLFQTLPDGASVYVSGQKRGKTPYKYSDTKIAFSSTPITFKKNGYQDLDTILKRNERAEIGAIIAMPFLYVPALWFLKYDPTHYYELEKKDSFVQAEKIIPDLNNSGITVTDTSINKQTNLAAHDTTPDNDLTILNDSNLNNETDSLENDYTKRSNFYFGIDGGFCNRGGIIGMDLTFISSNNWGGSISYKANIFKSRNIDPDYYSDGNRVFAPKDYVNIVSFNLVKEFSSSKESQRFGIEAGPSWVNYSRAVIKLNPNYNPDSEWFWSPLFKYNKSHVGSSTIGVSLRAKMEFLLSPSVGIVLAAFTNVNNLITLYGFEFNFIFGNVGN